ncbi:hypothetical protein NDU88_002686 [Pleurodeles waltl]|uniref:Prolactin receptor n=1 Tax=Pleurodeles waltl TaxID=8319 RepID=A0AAV7PAS1_PLEWA|nr:hypothetical protein NDU88_002686 [Pleurodeles waltl]
MKPAVNAKPGTDNKAWLSTAVAERLITKSDMKFTSSQQHTKPNELTLIGREGCRSRGLTRNQTSDLQAADTEGTTTVDIEEDKAPHLFTMDNDTLPSDSLEQVKKSSPRLG